VTTETPPSVAHEPPDPRSAPKACSDLPGWMAVTDGPAGQGGFADALASVVAINADLIERIVAYGARLKRQNSDATITEREYGGEIYRLVKALRHANDLLVDRLTEHLPSLAPLVTPASSIEPRRRTSRLNASSEKGSPPMPGREPPRGIDASVAHSARVYDWWLGGKDNFAADRDLGQRIVDLVPMTPASARTNRAFLHRAAAMIAAHGVHQFLDLGAGLPTADNTHAVVQRVAPDNRVVYVDYDPLVLAHARALLAGYGPTTVVEADIRDPDTILSHPEVTDVIDFAQPVCVLAVAVLHFLADDDDPHRVVNRLRLAMAPGSYLVLSHLTGDGTGEADEVIALMRKDMADPPTPRSRAEVLRFFDGFDLLDPGVVPVHRWRPADRPSPPRSESGLGPRAEEEPFWMYAGVGRARPRR
jgi:SAM-dependent methyltransferase